MTDASQVAATDQARAEARDFASCIADYHIELRRRGLEAYDALELTQAYQAEKFAERRPLEEDG